jgi:MFS family permease
MPSAGDEAVAKAPGATLRTAFRFVLLLGIVDLFADTTYEGARSVAGPFLQVLGASAAAVGFVAGFGEFVGYGLRLLSGYAADRRGRYWAITLGGYALNLFAVPLLALAGRWEVAALLLVAERAGRGIRVPARDVMLSHATSRVGHGWGFGVHEALDQVGAVAGPLVVAGALYLGGGYHLSFGLLAIPASLSLLTLLAARRLYPRPQELEGAMAKPLDGAQGAFPRIFWVYLAGIACVGIGYADFSLLAFHLKANSLVPDVQIPVFFAIAMAIDGLAALLMGRLFDRWGLGVLIPISILTALIAPLAFSFTYGLILAGVVLWGVGMGAQESIMRSAIATMVPPGRRGSAYGVFNMAYGLFWFLGSAALGILYGISLTYLIAFSLAFELASLPLLLLASMQGQRGRGARTPSGSP